MQRLLPSNPRQSPLSREERNIPERDLPFGKLPIPGGVFLNILSSGKGIRGLWIAVAITMKNGREMKEGGGKRRKDEGSKGERANLSPSRHFVLREWGWENFSLHQLPRLPSDKFVLFL